MQFVVASDLNDPVLRKLYRDVLSPMFADNELIGEDEMVASLSAGNFPSETVETPNAASSAGIVVLDEHKDPIACVIGEWFPSSRALLISYLAVAPQARGKGLGTELIARALDQWPRRFSPLLILGEVEDPRFFKDDSIKGNTLDRLRLYERLGAKFADINYFQPSLGPSKPRVRNLLLTVAYIASDCLLDHQSHLPGSQGDSGGGSADNGEAYEAPLPGSQGGVQRVKPGILSRFIVEYFSAAEQLSRDHPFGDKPSSRDHHIGGGWPDHELAGLIAECDAKAGVLLYQTWREIRRSSSA